MNNLQMVQVFYRIISKGVIMKKIIIVLIILLSASNAFAKSSYLDKQLKDVQNNTIYNSVQKYKRNYENIKELNVKKIPDLKDPKLIELAKYTPIDDKDYKAKEEKDNAVYKKLQPKIKNSKDVDYFNVYKISERLIRANNLDYVNWRIAIRKTVDKVNAASLNGNFVYINTALYDSLNDSEDALAFVLAHEMAHQILGHNQRNAEMAMNIASAKESARRTSTTKLDRQMNNAIISMAEMNAMSKSRMMEYMADAEAFILLYKAGYSPEKAMEALNLLDALPNIKTPYNTHPVTPERIASAKENILVLDPNWVYVGRENIYKSDVLTAKKSADRVSFVISKSKKDKPFYEPETYGKRLKRVAYMSYLNGNMESAAGYFFQLAQLTNDYVPYLYTSYANEYIYKKTQKRKFLKRAFKSAFKANELKPNDENVLQQISDLKLLKSKK